MTKYREESKGIVGLVTATFIYGFFGILTRTVGFELPIFFASWTRGILALGILAIPLFGWHLWKSIKRSDLSWFILRSIGGIFGFFGSYFSFYYIPIGTAYFIFYGGSTIGGYAFGKLLFHERLTRIKILSLVLALAGLCIIYAKNVGGGNPFYMMAAFVGGLGTATWNVFSKKISGTYTDVQLNFMDFLLSFVTMFIFSLVFREYWVTPTLNAVWVANLLFVFMFLLTGQLMVYGFKRLDAQIGSLVMLTEVLFGVILGYFFYNEIPSIYSFIGGLLILFAIILPEIRWKRLFIHI